MIKLSDKPILTAQQMQMADQFTTKHHGITSVELMERAGQAIATTSNKQKLDGGRVLIFIGPGNNGGDGFVAARLLRGKQTPVTVIPLFHINQLQGESARQAELASKAGVKIRPLTSEESKSKLDAWIKRAVIIVDAIFGTGLTRPITGWPAKAIERINQAHCPILAVDIPTGIHADSGKVLGTAVQATVTLPIAAYKWGHWLQQGPDYSGTMLTPASIGITSTTIQHIMAEHPIDAVQSLLIDLPLIKQALPARPSTSFKQVFGHLWIFGGSVGYTGAPTLAATGAQAVGAGLVSIACHDDVYPIIAGNALEIMVHPQQTAPWKEADAIVAGPGWGKGQVRLLDKILRIKAPVVLDADALNMLAADQELQESLHQRSGITVLTPHAGEAARLLNTTSSEIQKSRLDSALSIANTYKVWVVLKGAQTLVVSPEQHVWLNPYGSVNLAVAGTGDVLAGMIGGLLSASIAPDIAIPTAVGLHGLAGEQQGWHKAGQLEGIIANLVQDLRP